MTFSFGTYNFTKDHVSVLNYFRIDDICKIEMFDNNNNNNNEGYESHYQNKINGKSKGSGLGLYMSEELIFEELPNYCTTTVNMEALFVKITNTKEEITVGVVYRPPNGNLKLFLLEIQEILKKLPKDHVYLVGDFNINLHDIDEDNYASKFDRTILEHGFAPSISLLGSPFPSACIPSL